MFLRECRYKEHFDECVRLFIELKEDFGENAVDEEIIKHAMSLAFEKGKVYMAEKAPGVPVGLVGYTFGDPDEQYKDPTVAFVLFTMMMPNYRKSMAFIQGFAIIAQFLQESGIREMRLKALKSNLYTNRLYSKFAERKAEVLNMKGLPCILYAADVSELQERLPSLGRKRLIRC
ncbi:hypothetical protein DFP97_11455 [Paenibacillus prosopidis]|uniref:N-acetyltransferase domain-containing protein n=1 Tax=Paenibacillus prosopidis TaxID=630520 RepID=A0A368VQ58_9BACL|nr:hypothetical protein DFP97_11455 [Paenibacillus prosopidis]